PAAVVVAEDTTDVVAAVRFARAERLGVGVMATGHGTTVPCHGGVLVNTSRMTDVHVDPVLRTARVGAGVRWGDVVRAAAPHRLAGLPGSSSQVGVVGYLMGGGFGWLGRKYGFAASSLIQAEVVTADGEVVQASAHNNADLFWGLKGGSGNFGIVTAAEFALHPVENVYAGNLFYPVERARDVLTRYGSWSRSLPDEMMTAVAFRRFPPMPTVPEPLRGRTFAAVRACYCGEDLAEGERLVKPLREALGEPETDTFAIMPVTDMDTISMDPVQPIGAFQHMEMLRDLTPAAIETLVRLGRRAEPHRAQQRPVQPQRGGPDAHPGVGPPGPVVPELPHRGRPAARDRDDLPQLPGARRGDAGPRPGGLLARGLGAPGRPEVPLRPAQPVPLQPQHPACGPRTGRFSM